MVNKDLNSSQKILVKVDQNNLVFIDPNSVISDGLVEPRNIDQEKLVMYVNLEADLVPRSYLLSDTDQTRYVSIVNKTFNLLTPQTGTDLNTDWTESYTPEPREGTTKEQSLFFNKSDFADSSGQAFGIDSINITIKGANFIPQININFVDVRGKTLFEQPTNSPYSTFFHLPWPIFYLTIKGYYGKAIRYRLHLVKFSSKYNESNGNFEIATSFVGSTYAYLNDIPFEGIINAPYIYANAMDDTKTFNEESGTYKQEVKRSSKGYLMLKSVYAEMMQKCIIPKDFPTVTLREVEYLAMSMDKTLEKTIFNEVLDPKALAKIEEYNKAVSTYVGQIKGWLTENIALYYNTYNDVRYFFFNQTKNALSDVKLSDSNASGTLSYIITNNNNIITKIAKDINGLTINNDNSNKNIKPNFIIKTLKESTNYYEPNIANTDRGGQLQYGVKVDILLSDMAEIQNLFYEESSRIMKELEKQINVIVRRRGLGLGFDPTIKNIFAIIMANAEVYIRMLKDVHVRAFDAGNERKKLLQPFDKETQGSSIYPWPEVKKEIPGSRTQIIAYPGDFELRKKLKSENKLLWPEVDFIEEYIKFVTKVTKVDKVDYFFSKSDEDKKLKKICTIFDTLSITPYGNRVLSSFLYEIFERAKQITLVDSFNSEAIQELAKVEFENLQMTLESDVDVVDVLKNKVHSITDLIDLMAKFSPFERYPYYKDSIPTTGYISDSMDSPFDLVKYDGVLKKIDIGSYPKINENIKNYKLESYREKLYPFSSDTYLGYLKSTNYTLNNFDYSKTFTLESDLGFITSPVDSTMWIKDNYKSNIFKQNLKIGNNYTNILNTPYFHKQLYYDFSYNPVFGRYAGSSYLLLNSLPFKDLEDSMNNSNLRMASMFKEIGATHFVPYFLILKWGSMYHRYKEYLTTGIDILHGDDPATDYGCLSISGETLPISGTTFFNDNNLTGNTFVTIPTGKTQGTTTEEKVVSYDGKHTGLHPFYDAIYHNIINGYMHFDITDFGTFKTKVEQDYIYCANSVVNNLNQWTSFVDTTYGYAPTDPLKRNKGHFTIMPSYGFNQPDSEITDELLKSYGMKTREEYLDYIRTNPKSFDDEFQNSFRVILESEEIVNTFSGKTFAGYNEYIKSVNNEYSIDSNNKKVIDLIGTFSPVILDQFEEIFLYFASEELNVQVPQYRFEKLPYNTFQSLLKDVVSLDYFSWKDVNDLKKNLYNNQNIKLGDITKKIVNDNNLLKLTLGNPKELNSYIIEGFANIAPQSTLTFNPYDSSQLTPENKNLIKLYIGEFPDTGSTNFYESFFENMDIELIETNIINLRPLILIYAGYSKGKNVPVLYKEFKDYISTNVYEIIGNNVIPNGANRRLNLFLVSLIGEFTKLKYEKNTEANIEFYGGFNDEGLKIELYNFFKSYNDKWASGNSIGQRLLMEDFLFLDKANRDIGDRGYINLNRFIDLMDTKNANTSLYGAISILLQGSGFDMRALPSYVNFYGKSLSSKSKILPSGTVAENLFGTFLDVDYEDSMPKMVIQYMEGPLSKHPDITNDKTNKFNDDSFDMSDNNNNPIIITDPNAFTVQNMLKSNRAVAFEVSFGDQNQSIFKGVTLDQNTLRNTTESFSVLENLARSETGAGISSVDTSLFDYYRQASYSCEVSAMGNMMIQPTMFFYLKNIPMFKGSFWITDVSHTIKNNTINTTFKGTRIPRAVLPDPIDSFVASFRPIMDRIFQKAMNSTQKNVVSDTPTTERGIITSGGTQYSTDMGTIIVPGEKLLDNLAGITEFGLPYNGWGGEKYIQKVNYKGLDWFRAVVCKISNSGINDNNDMVLLSENDKFPASPDTVKWVELKALDTVDYFYTSKFKLINGSKTATLICDKTTTFLNPKNNKTIPVISEYQLDRRNDEYGFPKPLKAVGAVSIGPSISGRGIALSEKLMYDLGLQEGEVVYFNFN